MEKKGLPKNLPMPRCPGCGKLMRMVTTEDSGDYGSEEKYWFYCDSCDWGEAPFATR